MGTGRGFTISRAQVMPTMTNSCGHPEQCVATDRLEVSGCAWCREVAELRHHAIELTKQLTEQTNTSAVLARKPRFLADLSLAELRRGLAEITRTVGPDCGSARIYRRTIEKKEHANSSQDTPAEAE